MAFRLAVSLGLRSAGDRELDLAARRQNDAAVLAAADDPALLDLAAEAALHLPGLAVSCPKRLLGLFQAELPELRDDTRSDEIRGDRGAVVFFVAVDRLARNGRGVGHSSEPGLQLDRQVDAHSAS